MKKTNYYTREELINLILKTTKDSYHSWENINTEELGIDVDHCVADSVLCLLEDTGLMVKRITKAGNMEIEIGCKLNRRSDDLFVTSDSST